MLDFSSLIWQYPFYTEESCYFFIVLGKGLLICYVTLFLVVFMGIVGLLSSESYFVDKVVMDVGELKVLEGNLQENYSFKFFCSLFPMFNIFFFEMGGVKEVSNGFSEMLSKGSLCFVSFLEASQWSWFQLDSGLYDFLVKLDCLCFGFFCFENLEYFKLDMKLLENNTSSVLFVLMGYFFLCSFDVIHSYFCLEWGFKLDVIPGSMNSFKVLLDSCCLNNNIKVVCAEFCGVNHSYMDFEGLVVEDFDFVIKWLEESVFICGLKGLDDMGATNFSKSVWVSFLKRSSVMSSSSKEGVSKCISSSFVKSDGFILDDFDSLQKVSVGMGF